MKKYLYSLGVSFYAEKEMLRLEEQARKGWQFVKMNRWGFLVFEKAAAQEKQFAVDFYTGSDTAAEIAEYLEMYEASGWTYISDYQKKYFYFMADKATPKIFSDQISYAERLAAEQKWSFKNAFKLPLAGALIVALITVLLHYGVIGKQFFVGIILGLGLGMIIFPFTYLLFSLFMNWRYKNRAEFYQQPEAFAKKQRVWLDSLMNMLIGLLLGGLIGFIYGYFF